MYKRGLVKDIRSAYYNFLRADQALSIYTNAENSCRTTRLTQKHSSATASRSAPTS